MTPTSNSLQTLISIILSMYKHFVTIIFHFSTFVVSAVVVSAVVVSAVVIVSAVVVSAVVVVVPSTP